MSQYARQIMDIARDVRSPSGRASVAVAIDSLLVAAKRMFGDASGMIERLRLQFAAEQRSRPGSAEWYHSIEDIDGLLMDVESQNPARAGTFAILAQATLDQLKKEGGVLQVDGAGVTASVSVRTGVAAAQAAERRKKTAVLVGIGGGVALLGVIVYFAVRG